MLKGVVSVPGDKSITHRALLLAALASGTSEIIGPLQSRDCQNTVSCLRALGIEIEEHPRRTIVHGVGLTGFRVPGTVLDCGNSGTTMRLLAGILAAQPFVSVLTGDESLLARPMDRIVQPLRQMGALIKGRMDGQFAPLVIRGGPLTALRYELPVASAQVKSALLLAGLAGRCEVRLQGKLNSRDHTERMLVSFGADLTEEHGTLVLSPVDCLTARAVQVPGDISSAAIFLAGAAGVPGAEVTVENVGLNPTRTGFIDVLRAMGAEVSVVETSTSGGEPCGSITVRGRELRGIAIAGEIIPRLIDEIPILAVTAAFAHGTTTIKDAAELRVKETDRIQALAAELSKVGVDITVQPDGLTITGPTTWRPGEVNSRGDHRIAMSLFIAAALSGESISVTDADCVDVSFPGFQEILTSIVGKGR
ncbi:MAG: 3-phosphoshikimate 1-carboxyvinyltransferase [Firmicutes bacterium]|jgi:3-phosphoshikimate 1-carboxyvinyltransferase|nr:3-phosphoshikimate 1-carboxyvinyltransferase [Bacillota bacterium]